jgi:hypothetical protein
MSGSVSPGEVMPGELVGTVIASRHPAFVVGDTVLTRGGWRSHCLAEGHATALPGLAGLLAPVAQPIRCSAAVPASAYLGVLGMPGLTAYAMVQRLLRPQAGEHAVVFAATGAVGSVAGQLLRLAGAHTVAVVGSADKARHAREALGFDDAVVRTSPHLASEISRACPQGMHMLVANDGGPALATWLGQLALHARVALIGDMSQYNAADLQPGPALGQVIARRATLSGFVVFDHFDLLPAWQGLASDWLAQGRLVFHEDACEGLEQAPAHFARLMRGQTRGKALVRLA